MDPVEQLYQSALTLSESDRIELAHMLLASIDQATRDEIEAAWADEIKDRLDEIDRGEVEMIPWETVKEEFWKRAGIGPSECE